MMAESRTFTFNRPWALIFVLPLALLCLLFVQGLFNEFSLAVLLMVVLSVLLMGLLVYMSLFRKVAIGAGKVGWKTPFAKQEFDLSEVKSFGIAKFRRFKFIYFSLSLDPGYTGEKPIVTDAETIVLQFREQAWQQALASMKAAQPDLIPNIVAQ